MNTFTRNLFISCVTLMSMIFSGVTGEFSTNVTVGDSVSFSSPYTGVTLSGDGWELSTNLSNSGVTVEEAKYTWPVTDKVTATFGSQAIPYGNAWGLHRPSNNAFVSVPREHTIANGVGLGTSVQGVEIQAFYGNDDYWATRLSYSLWDQNFGLSVDGNEALLVDVSGTASVLGFPIATSAEYDLSENNNGAYWVRSTVTPSFGKGASIVVGYNSDDELTYGLGYKCSDNCYLSTELSAEGDTMIRVSYSF